LTARAAAANRLTLAAQLIRLGKARYTPAGLLVQEFGFRFAGTVVEANAERQLDFELDAVAVGDVAERLARVALGTPVLLSGFVAPAGRRSTRLRVHVTDYRTD
jgi:primosomal replication protein N